MLDLKELEEQLDKALNNETPESLTNWLANKRKVNYEYMINSKPSIPKFTTILTSADGYSSPRDKISGGFF